MDTQPEMLNFVKAMSDVDRLRIIGALTRGPATASQVAEHLGMPFRDVFQHLSFLAYIGVASVQSAARKQDEIYELDSDGIEKMARHQFEGPRVAYVPTPDLDDKSRKVLATFLNADGSIKQIPNQPAKLKIILDYLVAVFEPGVNYTEKEVNTVIRRFNVDTAGLRRDLIDAGLLARESDGSKYWRVDHGK